MKTQKTRYPLDQNTIKTEGFRPEIQGLRALAVLLVVIYHIWFDRVSGGVDVFLFISAFLLSLSSLRKINQGTPLAPLKYWLHVFQRLLPAAATVVIATTIASLFIYAPSRLLSIIQDAIATLLYQLNWHLAFSSVDYYANNASTKTPFQHFWSLSMQGQIFIIWPLIFILLAVLTQKLRLNLIGSAVLIFGSIWTASLTFSIIETYTNQGFAYFDTRTRLWEFASGTLLAILALKWTPPQKLRVPMGWIGVITLATCGFLLPVQEAFPGYLALVPLAAGALVILAGRTESPYGVDRLLTSKPLLKLGESSYALYLVHWPLFILYAAWAEKNEVNYLEGTVLIILSLILARLLHTFVEQPLRKIGQKPADTNRRHLHLPFKNKAIGVPLVTITSTLALALAPISFLYWQLQQRESEMSQLAQSVGTDEFPGALALNQTARTYDHAPIPETDPVSQFDWLPECTDYQLAVPALYEKCGYQNFSNSPDAPLTIIVGDSHAEQAISFYRPIAEQNQHRVATYLLGGCRFPLTTAAGTNETCATFNENAKREILAQKPDNVLLMVTSASPETAEEKVIPGVEEVIKEFTSQGIKVLALRDNPRFNYNMYECGQNNLDNLANCAQPLDTKLASQNPAAPMIDSIPGAYGIDLTDLYCPEGTCQAVIGNVYVYLDDNHVSKAYASTTSPEAYRQLTQAGWTP